MALVFESVGLLAGPSSGTAVAAALRVARELRPAGLVVVLLPDSGRSYLSKVFSDDWMRRWGFFDEDPPDGTRTAANVLARRDPDGGRQAGPPFVTVDSTATVDQALEAAGALLAAGVPLAANGVSRDVALVVAPRPSRPYGLTAAEVVGSFSPARLADDLAAGLLYGHAPVAAHADAPPPTVGTGSHRARRSRRSVRQAPGRTRSWSCVTGGPTPSSPEPSCSAPLSTPLVLEPRCGRAYCR